jgi:heat shock protein HslJ
LKGQTTTNTTQNQTGANTTEGTKTNQVSPQNVSNQSKSEPSQVNIQPSFSAPASKKLSLEGTFKPNNVNLDSDLLIVFEDIETVSISNGCNMHSGFYSAFENGTVKFGEFFSTTRVCKVDFDKTYLDALKQSDSFTKKGKDLSLNSGSKLSLSLAWQLPQSPALPSETNNSQTTIPESPK